MDDTQVKAVKYLIKQAPAGEIQDVLQDLHTLIGSPQLLNQSDQIMKALKYWYETHKYHIMLPDGSAAMVTSQGCLASGDEPNPIDWFQYYDDVLKKSFSFDPITQAASVLEGEQTKATSQLRESLVTSTNQYIEKAYRKNKALY